MSNEEIKIFRKLKALNFRFNEIMKKIEAQQVISREEFRLYEQHEKFETYTRDYYNFKCPKCSDSYDVIIRGSTANENLVHIIYVEDEKIEK